MSSHYARHLFICTNRRTDGRGCCADFGAQEARAWLKQRCKALGIHGEGQVRVNSAGCLGRCAEGPALVIYPEAVWYTFVDREDLEEIITRHLLQGVVVERLLLPGQKNIQRKC